MLIQFSVSNFKTFKDKATLNLIASNYEKGIRENENICDVMPFKLRILKSAVIYGANASGKSKYIEALTFMKRFIINSSKESQKGELIDVEPFRLNDESETQASEFEVTFLHDNAIFRYGFEVNKQKVVSEWLFHRPKTKEVEIFYRDYQNFEIHSRSFPKGTTLVREGLIRDNALLLSVAAQFNDALCENIIEWFKGAAVISGLNEINNLDFTISKTKDPTFKEKILELLKAADLGIQDIRYQKLDLTNEKGYTIVYDMQKILSDKISNQSNEENEEYYLDTLTSHKKFNNLKMHIGNVNLSMENDESQGTSKFFALAGPILDALESGHVLVVDELDSKLHPNLVCKIVSLFNSKEFNPKNAQLIFNTHDTNLLSSGLFRKDQVWFTEKNKYGEAKLYSLSDFKAEKVRKNEAFEYNYIRGKYGAIPFLDFFDNLVH